MDWEKTYLEYLPRIERIAGFVARKRGRLNPDETTEFVQVARVGLFEDDYAIFRKFQGRSSLSTYLTTVIVRLFFQYQVESRGKWRPSAEAKRLGATAIELERLMTRDGYTFNEAVQVLTVRAGATVTPEQLRQLYIRLPNRNPRPNFVSDEAVPDSAAVDVNADADARVEAREREHLARKIEQSFNTVLRTLDEEDCTILRMHFQDGGKLADIARVLNLDQKQLYKRFDRLKGALRQAIEANGVSRADVDTFLECGDREIRLDLFDSEENPNTGPPNSMGEEDGDPEE